MSTTPRKPEGWQGYIQWEREGVRGHAAYNYLGGDSGGITSVAASDLERVVKVIDKALEYANDNYEADVLPGDSAARQRRDHKAIEAAQRQPTSTNARRSRQAG